MKTKNANPRFPLGVPVNRATGSPSLRPIPGRPNWYVDARGVEHYVEPGAPLPGPASASVTPPRRGRAGG